MTTSETLVCSLKLKNGDNILGYLLGEQQDVLTGEHCLNVFKPIRMFVSTTTFPNGSVSTNYIPQLYAPFGSPVVVLSIADILHYDLASPFYSRLYSKVLGEILVVEEEREKRITANFDAQELKAILSETDSIYFNQESEYKH